MEQDIVPLVSVVMPVYNSALYLRESIDSILQQNFRDFEFLIIDDGSTDDSLSVIRSYDDSRIVLIVKPVNSGIADSFNTGITRAKGKYIARMDSDDIAMADRLEKQVRYMEIHQDVLALGGAFVYIDGSFRFDPPLSYEEVKIHSIMDLPVANPTIFIRRNLFTEHGLKYEQSFEPAEDFEMATRIIDRGRVENIPDVLLHYRTHTTQSTSRKAENQRNAVEKIRIRQLNKLIFFDHKQYDSLFAINVLRHQPVPVSSESEQNVIALLSDLYSANKAKKIYDDRLLFQYLRSSWLHFFNHQDKPVVQKYQLFLATRKNTITRMGYREAIKYITRSFVKKVLKRGVAH